MSTRASAVHPEKAEPAIVVRFEQTVRSTVTSEVQFWKKLSPSEVSLQSSGKTTVDSDAQFLKTAVPNVERFAQGERSADWRPAPLKALLLIVERFGQFANEKDDKEAQSMNAPGFSVVSGLFAGMVNVERFVHPLKAFQPIDEQEAPMTNSCSFVHRPPRRSRCRRRSRRTSGRRSRTRRCRIPRSARGPGSPSASSGSRRSR